MVKFSEKKKMLENFREHVLKKAIKSQFTSSVSLDQLQPIELHVRLGVLTHRSLKTSEWEFKNFTAVLLDQLQLCPIGFIEY